MAPRTGGSTELARFLRTRKEPIVGQWLTNILSKPELRKKLSSWGTPEELSEILGGIYDSLILPLTSVPSAGKTRKVRLSKRYKERVKTLRLDELQQAQLILLDILSDTVREHYFAKPQKAQRLEGRLRMRTHDLLLQTARAVSRRREKAAAGAESKYAELLEMANDAIFLLNYDTGLFVEVNEAACGLTGYSEAELKSMGFNSLVSVFDLNLALEKANDAIEQGAARFDDLSILTKKKKTVPVDISATAVTIDGSKHILAIARDIAQRKEYERKIKEKANHLKLVNEIAQAISLADLDIESVLETILKSIARVIRVEAGSILRLDDDTLEFLVALGEKASLIKPFRLKLGQGIAGWVAETGEGLIVRDVQKDSRYYADVERATGFVSKSILAVPMKRGETTVGVIELINKVEGAFTKRDLDLIGAISSFAAVALEHARLYSECELSKARLAQYQSPVSSSRLAAVVAHEMKDPLGIAKNYIRILADKLASGGAEHEELAVVSEEVDRIANITDQLLHFSEAYSDEPKETPLNLLVENSIVSMKDKLDAAGISTELRLTPKLPRVSVIPNQMKMVFANLIKLSIAEMPEGGTLTVATRKRDSSILIEFSNTGIRHTIEEANELFLPSAVAKGIVPKGLGLYMVHNIIQSYGGDIEVASRRGQGNVLRIKIPLNGGASAGNMRT